MKIHTGNLIISRVQLTKITFKWEDRWCFRVRTKLPWPYICSNLEQNLPTNIYNKITVHLSTKVLLGMGRCLFIVGTVSKRICLICCLHTPASWRSLGFLLLALIPVLLFSGYLPLYTCKETKQAERKTEHAYRVW